MDGFQFVDGKDVEDLFGREDESERSEWVLVAEESGQVDIVDVIREAFCNPLTSRAGGGYRSARQDGKSLVGGHCGRYSQSLQVWR